MTRRTPTLPDAPLAFVLTLLLAACGGNPERLGADDTTQDTGGSDSSPGTDASDTATVDTVDNDVPDGLGDAPDAEIDAESDAESDAENDIADSDSDTTAACPGGAAATVGVGGGEIQFTGGRLRVPAGALATPAAICVTATNDAPPPGYTGYTRVFLLEPAGLVFAVPAELELDLPAGADHPVAFLSARAGPGFEWRGGRVLEGRIVSSISHFSQAFAGDGTSYTEPVDPTCARVRLIEGRTTAPSAVSAFVRVEDCHGAPFTVSSADDLVVTEDGQRLSVESSAVVVDRTGIHEFVHLVLDMSASTAPRVGALIESARAFVAAVDARGLPGVHYAVSIFTGAADNMPWLRYTTDVSRALAALDDLATYEPQDRLATNLHGALVESLAASASAQREYQARNEGGVFTHGHIVLFTDGRDTAGWLTEEEALAALAASTDVVIAVGLETPDFDASALAMLAPDGVFTAADQSGLATAFGAVANRIAGIVGRSYLVGYCSPRKNGIHAVEVGIEGVTNVEPASYVFDATGFTGGCSAALFETACEGRVCGGLGCGGCGDTERCVEGACSSECTWSCANGRAGPVLGDDIACADECDRDGIAAPLDTCAFLDDPDQLDHDGDRRGDPCDDDDDGDGRVDEGDACPLGATGWASDPTADHDADGCRDLDEDGDDDDDGRSDEADDCPRGLSGWSASSASDDSDADGCHDVEDGDDDGDGVVDSEDLCADGDVAWVAGPTTDRDADGCRDGSLEDPDGDGDGLVDDLDACASAAGFVSTPASDHDADGCSDSLPPEDADDDDDGVPDPQDLCPRGLLGVTDADLDGDGCRDSEDEDDDGDGLADGADPCPRSAKPLVDYDRDGCTDAEDEDDDADGVADAEDRCRLGEMPFVSETLNDRDADGCRDDGEDSDDDGDGVDDAVDACPMGLVGAPAGQDGDGDGCRDEEDDDDDNDRILDEQDGCDEGSGWVSTRATDLDHDGCRDDTEDSDDDGDGVPDERDACPRLLQGSSDGASDPDGDGCLEHPIGDDQDGDGVSDARDLCPFGPTPTCNCGTSPSWCFDSLVPLAQLPNYNPWDSLALTPDGGACLVDPVTVRRFDAQGVVVWEHEHGQLGPEGGYSPTAISGDETTCTILAHGYIDGRPRLLTFDAAGRGSELALALEGDPSTGLGFESHWAQVVAGGTSVLHMAALVDGLYEHWVIAVRDGATVWRHSARPSEGWDWAAFADVLVALDGMVCTVVVEGMNLQFDSRSREVICWNIETGAFEASVSLVDSCVAGRAVYAGFQLGRRVLGLQMSGFEMVRMDFENDEMTCVTTEPMIQTLPVVLADDGCTLAATDQFMPDLPVAESFLGTCRGAELVSRANLDVGQGSFTAPIVGAVQVRDGGVDAGLFFHSDSPEPIVVLARLTACDLDLRCDDGDLCTEDLGTPPMCAHPIRDFCMPP